MGSITLMERPKSPCTKDCIFRSVECKSRCVDLKNYEKEYKEFLAKKEKVVYAKLDLHDYKSKIIAKAVKKKRK